MKLIRVVRRGRCGNSGKRNLAPGFREGKTVNLKEHKPQQKLHTLVEAKIIDSVAHIWGTMHKIHANINAAKTNTVVTSKMKMVTGWGPDKISLVKGYTPRLSEEVD